jgi:hypothetical protein
MGLLVKEHMSNPAFAGERKAIQRHYAGAIKSVATAVLDWAKELPSMSLGSLANEEVLQEDLRKRVENLPELVAYTDQLDVLCQKHHLDYGWGSRLLFYEDVYNALQLNEEEKLISVSGALSPIVGLPAYVMLPIPTACVYLGTSKEIHEYIDNELDKLPRQSDSQDIPHALELHVKWFYAWKVLGKSSGEIAQAYGKSEDFQIRRAIRDIDRLLGGKRRPRGRPKAGKD